MSRRLEESYTEFPLLEEAFRVALDESLRPRSPELLYEIVAGLGLPEGSLAVDVGCGDGRHSYRLAERFGFSVVGIDPFPPDVDEGRVRLLRGSAESLPSRTRPPTSSGAAASWRTSRIPTGLTRSSTGCCATAATRSCTRPSRPIASSRARPSGCFRRSTS